MNWIGGLNGCKRKFNITTIKLLQKSSNFQLLLSLCSRFPGTKTTHTKCNHKETTSMQSICTGNNIFLQVGQKKNYECNNIKTIF